MDSIIDYDRLKILVNEIFWNIIPVCKNIPFEKGPLSDLGIDSLDALDLAAEFHFRFDMLSGNKEAYLLQYDKAEDWMEQIFKAANDPNRRFGFFSSGSSGQPKTVWHEKSYLLEERDYWLEVFKPKGVICLVPVRHIYGFIWGLLLGTAIKRTYFFDSSQWNRFQEVSTSDDLIVGFPAVWQHVKNNFPHRMAISSTESIDEEITKYLMELNINGTNIYGSTETGGIGFQNWESDTFRLIPFWEKKGNMIFRNNKFFELPDELIWMNSNQFNILGRKDDLVQIGGENISTNNIREQLMQLKGVKNVWVKPYHTNNGNRIFAYLQIQKDMQIESAEKDLKSLLKTSKKVIKLRKYEIGYETFNKFSQ